MKAKHLMMALAIMAVLCLGLSGCQTKNERIALVADGAVQARIVYSIDREWRVHEGCTGSHGPFQYQHDDGYLRPLHYQDAEGCRGQNR